MTVELLRTGGGTVHNHTQPEPETAAATKKAKRSIPAKIAPNSLGLSDPDMVASIPTE